MRKSLLILVVLCPILITNTALTAEINLTGTWEGPTFAEGPSIELTFTLVLEHKDNTVTGKLNDDLGYINCEITEPKLEDNVFTFNAVANTPDGDYTMVFKMTVTENKMEGRWEIGTEAYGDWTAEKK